jgi:hypothetical protein
MRDGLACELASLRLKQNEPMGDRRGDLSRPRFLYLPVSSGNKPSLIYVVGPTNVR